MGSGGGDTFIAGVANILRWPDNSNMDSMVKVSRCLWMTSNPELGAMTCARNVSKTNVRHRSGQGRPAKAKEFTIPNQV